MPNIPGVSVNMTRVGNDGRFTFERHPGQHNRAGARNIRQATPTDPNAPAARRPGGRRGQIHWARTGGRPIAQVLWASVDVSVSGSELRLIVLNLQPGLNVRSRRISGHHAAADGSTRVRVNLRRVVRRCSTSVASCRAPWTRMAVSRFWASRWTPDARGERGRRRWPERTRRSWRWSGRGRRKRVAPRGHGFSSAVLGGRDTSISRSRFGPNQEMSNAVLTFTDKTQELSGTIQDALSPANVGLTIIVFPPSSELAAAIAPHPSVASGHRRRSPSGICRPAAIADGRDRRARRVA